jgi:hypothetical protein
MVTKRKRKRRLLAATRVRLLKSNLTRKLVRRERFVLSGGLSIVQLRQKITEMQMELAMAIRSGETDRTLNLIKKLMLVFVFVM